MRTYFFVKAPGISRFVTLPLEIPCKTKLHRWKFRRIMLYLLEIPRLRSKTHGTSM